MVSGNSCGKMLGGLRIDRNSGFWTRGGTPTPVSKVPAAALLGVAMVQAVHSLTFVETLILLDWLTRRTFVAQRESSEVSQERQRRQEIPEESPFSMLR